MKKIGIRRASQLHTGSVAKFCPFFTFMKNGQILPFCLYYTLSLVCLFICYLILFSSKNDDKSKNSWKYGAAKLFIFDWKLKDFGIFDGLIFIAFMKIAFKDAKFYFIKKETSDILNLTKAENLWQQCSKNVIYLFCNEKSTYL